MENPVHKSINICMRKLLLIPGDEEKAVPGGQALRPGERRQHKKIHGKEVDHRWKAGDW